jgi:endonuclease YncB( thermonuclease family)
MNKVLSALKFSAVIIFTMLVTLACVIASRENKLMDPILCESDTLGSYPVMRVVDGDTYIIGGARVRLIGVNTYELSEDRGQYAKRLVEGWVAARGGPRVCRAVLIGEKDRYDRYDRTLAHVVLLPDRLDLGVELLRAQQGPPMFVGRNRCREDQYRELYSQYH